MSVAIVHGGMPVGTRAEWAGIKIEIVSSLGQERPHNVAVQVSSTLEL